MDCVSSRVFPRNGACSYDFRDAIKTRILFAIGHGLILPWLTPAYLAHITCEAFGAFIRFWLAFPYSEHSTSHRQAPGIVRPYRKNDWPEPAPTQSLSADKLVPRSAAPDR